MNESAGDDSDATWKNVAPFLDAALEELNEGDRDAVLLRYFERKSAREMAFALGVSDEAAQKRVTRAIERLRDSFAKHGLTVSTSVIIAVITANAVQAAPLSLPATISSAITSATVTVTTQTTMHWLNLKLVASILAAALAAGTGTYLAQRGEKNQLRNENQNLAAHQKELIAQREAALAQSSESQGRATQSQSDKSELLRLRGELGVLRRQIAGGNRINSNGADPNRPIIARDAISKGEEAGHQVSANTTNALKLMMVSVMLYSLEHDHVCPTNFEQIVGINNLPAKYGGLTLLETLEFVSHATPINDSKNPDKIVLRERTARRTPEGKWIRAYALADGHVVEQLSDDGNYENWENQHRIIKP
jgi:hypothetical protein